MTATSRWKKVDAELAEQGRRLQEAGLVHARSGNMSVRTATGFRVTAAGARLGRLHDDDLVSVPAESAAADARRPSSETPLHAAIYRARPDVGAIVHTHSPYATAVSGLDSAFVLDLEEATYYGMGAAVSIVPSAPAGSLRLAHLTARRLADGSAALLARHGAVAVGPDLAAAVDVAESLEHQARVRWLQLAAPAALMRQPAERWPA